MRVLNVGGGDNRQLPEEYAGWDQIILDVNPSVKPDIVLDAMEMASLPGEEYDAVFCQHGIEHFYLHQVPALLKGFRHVLKPGGKVDLSLPNIQDLFRALKETNLELTDIWYRTPQGIPITFHDVLYGWGQAMSGGNLHYAHKSAYTPNMLGNLMMDAGFKDVVISAWGSNLYGKGVK